MHSICLLDFFITRIFLILIYRNFLRSSLTTSSQPRLFCLLTLSLSPLMFALNFSLVQLPQLLFPDNGLPDEGEQPFAMDENFILRPTLEVSIL